MLNFKSILIDNKSLFDLYLKKNSKTCDRAFVNLFCWQHFYKTQWVEYRNWLIIRAYINGERRMAYIPVSQQIKPDYKEILHVLLEDALQFNQTLTLMGLSEDECELVEASCNNCFIFDKNRDFADYIYLSESLKTLKGKKLAQKRNHINKFKSLYSYEYEPITKNNIHHCLKLEEKWVKQHCNDESAVSEYVAIKGAFDNFDSLGLIGGALFVDNEIVAFTYGSEINPETFCTHVEKGDIKYEGVYQMINYLFTQHLPEKYVYINREEDLGLPGLRKSKMSYNPEKMNFKTTALFKNNDMCDIISVWKKCFGKDDTTVFQFLSRYYFNHCSFVERVDGHIVAMLFVIPCQTNIGKAAYIYGVATDPKYQNQGISTKLMNTFFERCKKEDFNFAFLIPEDKALTNFYSKFGYKETAIKVEFTSDLDLGTGNTEKDKALIKPMKNDFEIDSLYDVITCVPML